MLRFLLLVIILSTRSNDTDTSYKEDKTNPNGIYIRYAIRSIVGLNFSIGRKIDKKFYCEATIGKNSIDRTQIYSVFSLFFKVPFEVANVKVFLGASFFRYNLSKNDFKIYWNILKNLSLFIMYEFAFKNSFVGLKIHKGENKNGLGVSFVFGFTNKERNLISYLSFGDFWKFSAGNPAFYDQPKFIKPPLDVFVQKESKVKLRLGNDFQEAKKRLSAVDNTFFINFSDFESRSARMYYLFHNEEELNKLSKEELEELKQLKQLIYAKSIFEALVNLGWNPSIRGAIHIELDSALMDLNLVGILDFIRSLLSLSEPKSNNVFKIGEKYHIIQGETEVVLYCAHNLPSNILSQIYGRSNMISPSYNPEQLGDRKFQIKEASSYSPLKGEYLNITKGPDGRFYYSYGEEKKEFNRLLITGKSGSGKTYSVSQLAKDTCSVIKVTYAMMARVINQQPKDFSIDICALLEANFADRIKKIRAEAEGKSSVVVHFDEFDKFSGVNCFYLQGGDPRIIYIFTGAFAEESNLLAQIQNNNERLIIKPLDKKASQSVATALFFQFDPNPKSNANIFYSVQVSVCGFTGFRSYEFMQKKFKAYVEFLINNLPQSSNTLTMLRLIRSLDPTSEEFLKLINYLVQNGYFSREHSVLNLFNENNELNITPFPQMQRDNWLRQLGLI